MARRRVPDLVRLPREHDRLRRRWPRGPRLPWTGARAIALCPDRGALSDSPWHAYGMLRMCCYIARMRNHRFVLPPQYAPAWLVLCLDWHRPSTSGICTSMVRSARDGSILFIGVVSACLSPRVCGSSPGLCAASARPLVHHWLLAVRRNPRTTWDQASFNTLARVGLSREAGGLSDRRLFRCHGHIVGGILPVALFAGGHAHFVSRMAWRQRRAPYSVHSKLLQPIELSLHAPSRVCTLCRPLVLSSRARSSREQPPTSTAVRRASGAKGRAFDPCASSRFDPCASSRFASAPPRVS